MGYIWIYYRPSFEQALRNQQLLAEKQRMDRALAQSEERFRSVIEQSFDGITLVDQDGQIVAWNDAEEQITGVRREDVLGRYIWDVTYEMMTPARRQEMSVQVLQTMIDQTLVDPGSEGLNRLSEYEMERPDGSKRTVQAARFRINLDDRVLLSEITRDITERKQMEDALRESEARFRALFELAPDAYYITDLAGSFVDGNHAAEMMSGLSRDEVIGRNLLEVGLLTPDQLPKVAKLLQQNAPNDFGEPQEFTLYPKNLVPLDVEIRSLLTSVNGEQMVLSIARDITWRKRAEDQMRQYIRQLEILHQLDEELNRDLDINNVQKLALEKMMEVSGASSGTIARHCR